MYQLPGPQCAVAFDHPETRAAWGRTRRRVRVRFALWSVVFVALLALSVQLTASAETSYEAGGNRLGAAVGALAVLWYPFVLYTCLGALSRLKQARSVLEAYPWQHLAAVRKAGGRDGTGVLVQLPLLDDTTEARTSPNPTEKRGSALPSAPPAAGSGTEDAVAWSPTMSARDPRRWNRWDERLTQGAWFAGDPRRWGVLALPGGAGLMTVQRSMANLSGERTSATTDRAQVLAAAPARKPADRPS